MQARMSVRDADPDELRAMVAALADALADAGDRHAGRGRPEKRKNIGEMVATTLAVRDYRNAITARMILDGDKIKASALARFCWAATSSWPTGVQSRLLEDRLSEAESIFAADMAGAREALSSPARELLKRLRLAPNQVERRRFKVITLQKIAEAHGISERMLRFELAK